MQEHIWFQFKADGNGYELPLYEVVSAVVFLSEKGYIPKNNQEWIDDVCDRYPYFKDNAYPITKQNQLTLSDNVIVSEEPEDDGEFVFFIAKAKHNQFKIGLHLILEMLLLAEQEGLVPRLDYTKFWQYIKDIYYNYFKTKGYHKLLCTDLK